MIHHIPQRYRLHPDDFQLLEISVGAITGQYTNIDATGAPGMLYNSFPHIQEYVPQPISLLYSSFRANVVI